MGRARAQYIAAWLKIRDQLSRRKGLALRREHEERVNGAKALIAKAELPLELQTLENPPKEKR